MNYEDLRKKPGLLIGAGAVALVAILLLAFLTSLSGVKTEGVAKEKALSARYSGNQVELSGYVTSIKEMLQVSDRKTDKLDKVLSDAVSGRYDNELSAATPNESNDLISAIVEAYPDLSGLDSYDKVMSAIESGRARFRNAQLVLLDEIAAYETWRDRGLWHSWIVGVAGFTSDGLEAHVGKTTLKGEEALAQMKIMVTDAQTTKDFETGETEPLDLNLGGS